MSRPTCATCAFWDRFEEVSEQGFCRRFPPLLASTNALQKVAAEQSDCPDHGMFPVVESHEWCGEHSNFQAFLAESMESGAPLIKCHSMLGDVRCFYPLGHEGAHAFDVNGDGSRISYVGDGQCQIVVNGERCGRIAGHDGNHVWARGD